MYIRGRYLGTVDKSIGLQTAPGFGSNKLTLKPAYAQGDSGKSYGIIK